MIIEELKQDFQAEGIDMKFIDDVPADCDPRKPRIWLERYPKTQMVFGCPEAADDFKIAYVAYEALALSQRIDLGELNPAALALQNAWVLKAIVERFDPEHQFQERITEILRWRISSIALNEDSDQKLAYELWSRMASIDAFEMLRPVRKARPAVAEMIEQIKAAWHVPADANDMAAMYKEIPVALNQ